ncbi:MAG: hypothetical protein ABWZ02_12750, partial [Nakamurella sp.]
MQRRIMGIETEFGITCTFHGQRRLSPDVVKPLAPEWDQELMRI